ncbi:MAG: IS200/IS605 family transposase [FCB group bacterium]|jgi:REP element-mobilizing transposase RayT
MSNTYTQIHIHSVFTVKNRDSLIQKEWKDELYMYITGIIKNNNHKLIIINGMPDHVHLLFGLRPEQSLSKLMQDIKANSSKWINEHNLVKEKFSWQEGYGAFSYSKSQLSSVIEYIKNKEKHHEKKTFIDEYVEFLKLFDISYDSRYIFKAVEI